MKIVILVIMAHLNSGTVITTQEFNSVEQCKYTISLMKERDDYRVVKAFCVNK
jgi:hypothetical protein